MTPYDDTKVETFEADEADQAERRSDGSQPGHSRGHDVNELKSAMRRAAQRRLRTRRIASFKR